MQKYMQVTSETVERGPLGRAVVIAPEGEVDMHESPRLRTALLDALAGGPAAVVVDLAGVSFMDSSGVATLVEAMKLAKGNQGLAGKILGMGRQTLNKRLKLQST